MATRARDYSDQTHAVPGIVQVGGGAAVEGMPAKIGSADYSFTQCGVDDDTYAGPFDRDAAEGSAVGVYGQVGAMVKHKVGTGGATRGLKGIVVADGYTNAPAHDSDGTGNEVIVCQFWESGVAGDLVMAEVLKNNRGS